MWVNGFSYALRPMPYAGKFFAGPLLIIVGGITNQIYDTANCKRYDGGVTAAQQLDK